MNVSSALMPTPTIASVNPTGGAASLDATGVHAWFGGRLVLEGVA